MFILICGLPNAGKTTYSQNFKNVLHIDEIGFNQIILDKLSKKHNDEDIIVEGIYGSPASRQKLVKAYQGKTKCIFLDVPFEEIVRRENRGRAEFVLQSAAKHFMPPTYDEGWDEIEVIKWQP